jgi:hypothetical protein
MKILLFLISFLFIHSLAAMDNDPSTQLWKLFAYYSHHRNYTSEQFIENVQTLIKAGADINFKPRDSTNTECPLISAIKKLNPNLCEIALAHGANLAPRGEDISILITLTYAAREYSTEWCSFYCEPSMPAYTVNEIPIFQTAFVIIKHMVRRHIATQKTAIKTFILCLTRIGRSDYRIGDFTRRSNALLRPYCLFNAKVSRKEMLFEELTKINKPQSRGTQTARDIYPCELLDPSRVEDTIERVLRPDKLQAEIDKE